MDPYCIGGSMKIFLGMIVFIMTTCAFAQKPNKYIVVGVAGSRTMRHGRGLPSGAHDNLPKDPRIVKTFKFTHRMNKKERAQVLSHFGCFEGTKKEKNLGLAIMINSWGAHKGYKLAKQYKKHCGEEVDIYVVVDGVGKPFHYWKKTPPAKVCYNYYQKKSFFRGRHIKGCENHNLSKHCDKGGLSKCHIVIEWMGTKIGARNIIHYFAD